MGNKLLTPSITHKYPTYRDHPIKSVHMWLDGRRADDNAEDLWRIHDKLYNLEHFADIHPGGQDWLRLTKGCDITEAFETHHISSTPEKLLQWYFVREAKEPRNCKLTFKPDGFYKTLKRRIAGRLPELDRNITIKSKVIQDFLLILTLALVAYAGKTSSLFACFMAGALLAFTTITSHNFLHKRDNWRMRIFNMSLMSFREWRISHVLSHHLYPNSLSDLELTFSEPFLLYLVYKDKNLLQRYVSWVYTWIIYGIIYFSFVIHRTAYSIWKRQNYWHLDEVLVPLVVPATIYFFGEGQTLWSSFTLWMWIIVLSGMTFSFVSINGSHHAYTAFHEGDPLREDLDFGKYTIDAVVERSDLRKSLVLVLTHFGDHQLHHLFPTIDHAFLPYLYDIYDRTCQEFEVYPEEASFKTLIKDQHLTLARTEPKMYPCGSKDDDNNNQGYHALKNVQPDARKFFWLVNLKHYIKNQEPNVSNIKT